MSHQALSHRNLEDARLPWYWKNPMPPSYELVYIKQSTVYIYIMMYPYASIYIYIHTIYIILYYTCILLLLINYILLLLYYNMSIYIYILIHTYIYIYIMYLHVYPLYTQRSPVFYVSTHLRGPCFWNQGALAWRPSSASGLHLRSSLCLSCKSCIRPFENKSHKGSWSNLHSGKLT